jgi:hypothetical protein
MMITSDDVFMVHIYGAFQETFQETPTQNATIDLRADCGSHCEEYGAPPGETPSETITFDFCDMSIIEQPLGGRKATCPPAEKGYALISSMGYAFPMAVYTPVRPSFALHLGLINLRTYTTRINGS